MFLHLGTQLYGKVDQVPGLFHVATQFFHLNFVPLVPMGSYLVLDGVEQPEGQPPGIAVEWNGKSVLMAWVRAGLMIGGPLLAVFAIIDAVIWMEGRGDGLIVAERGMAAAALLVLLPLTYRMTRAGPMRALVLARQAGIEPEVVAQYFVHSSSLPNSEERIV